MNGKLENRQRPQRQSTNSIYTALRIIAIAALLCLGLAWQAGVSVLNPFSPRLSGAAKVLRDNPLIDGHNDLLILIRSIWGNRIYNDNFTKPFEEGGMPGHFDFPRAQAGQMGGTFWSAFVSRDLSASTKPILI